MRLLLLLFSVCGLSAQTTRIFDVATDANGNPINGFLTVTWSRFTSATGQLVTASSTRVTVTGGVVDVSLPANNPSTPATPYFVTWSSGQTEQWSVPISVGALTLADVRVVVSGGTSGGSAIYEVPLTFSAPLVRTVNAITCPTCILSSGSYTNPAWIVSIAAAKITGAIAAATALAANGTNCPGGQAAAGIDAAGNAEGCFVASAGSVTSVSMTVPSWLAIAGSPITSSGTLAVAAATGQTANRVLATPDGSTGAVGLRALASADIPANAANTSGNAATATALAANGTNCTGGQVAAGVDASGNAEGCVSVGGTPNGIAAVVFDDLAGIASPQAGWLRYVTNATPPQVYEYNGTQWAPQVVQPHPDGTILADTSAGVRRFRTAPVFAEKANNLSDLASAATARTNLGVPALAASHAYSAGVAIDQQGARVRPPSLLFASLPAASGVSGYVYLVTDCLTAACSAGGGTIRGQLRSNGSTYDVVSPGTGGATFTSPALNNICTSNAGGTVFNCAPDARPLTWTGYILAVSGSIQPRWNGWNGSALDCTTTATIDPSTSSNRVNLNGNCTLSASTPFSSGQIMNVELCQDATGGRTVTWPAVFRVGAWQVFGGTTIQTGIVTTASTCSAMSFTADATKGQWLALGVGVTGQ
jgi:hypothetical protein